MEDIKKIKPKIESNVEALLVNACKTQFIKNIKGFSMIRGFPDRVVFNHITKQIYYIEVKAGTYYGQTKWQKKWEQIIKNSGGTYILIDNEEKMRDFIGKYILGTNIYE